MASSELTRIDTHIHTLPKAYQAAVKAAGGDPSGFPNPDWTPEGAIQSMNTVGTSIGEYHHKIVNIWSVAHRGQESYPYQPLACPLQAKAKKAGS